MRVMSSRRLSGAVLALASACIWGGMFPVVKSALPVMDAFYLTLIRYGTATIVLVALLVAFEGRRSLSLEGRGPQLLLLGSAGFAGFSLLAFVGLQYTRPQNEALIMATMPLITAVVTAARRRAAPPAHTMVAIAVALLGVAVVITHGNLGLLLRGAVGLGDLLALAGATCWVAYSMGGAEFPSWSPLRYTTLSAGLGTITIAAATAAATWSGAARWPSGGAVVEVGPQLVYLILLAAVVAVFTWNVGLKRLGSQNGILFINLVPVTTFSIEVVRGYHPNGMELLGAALTISALVANNLWSRRLATAGPVAAAAGATEGRARTA
jgi:drug/metabolite transporter (DMT)-like permease